MTKVNVTFIDAATAKPLGKATLDVEQLPETFALETTLDLFDKQWTVERAEPTTRADFSRTGTLTLTLREIQFVDPKTLLFSLPSLETALPATTEPAGPDAYRIHEDDWRQRELVAAQFAALIDEEIAAIREVHEERGDSAGFKRLHVRERIPAPLDGAGLTVDDISRAMPDATRKPFAIGGALVAGGFAFVGPDHTVYGTARDELVTAICFAGEPPPRLGPGLVYVDWCRCEMTPR
jgi:hypothetical protein